MPAPPPTPKPKRSIRTVIQQVPQMFYVTPPSTTSGEEKPPQRQLNPGMVAIAAGSLVIVGVLIGSWMRK